MKSLRFSCIYAIVNQENGKMYIGSAVNLHTRKTTHLSRLDRNVHHSPHLQNAYNKHGMSAFEFEIIEHVLNKNELLKREQVWINFFSPQYNICKTAGSRYGTKSSIETKKRISLANMGRVHSKETRQKIAERKLGRPLSVEHKLSLSLGHRGKERLHARKEILCENYKTGETLLFKGIKHCALILGCDRTSIHSVLTGRRKTLHKKYTFRYK